MQDEIDGQLFAIRVVGDQGGQVVLLVEWVDLQQDVAPQRGVLGDLDPPVSMAVFLPDMMFPLVMVLVFDAPVGAHCPSETHSLVGRQARDEAAGGLMGGFRAGLLPPLTPDLDRAVRREQPGIHRAERPNRGTPRVDTPVVIPRLVAQVKKGASRRAWRCQAAAHQMSTATIPSSARMNWQSPVSGLAPRPEQMLFIPHPVGELPVGRALGAADPQQDGLGSDFPGEANRPFPGPFV